MAQHPTDSKQIIIEIGHASATISNGNERSTVSLVRGSDGRLSEAGRAALKTSIHEAASSTGGDAAVKATCAIAARGVSLRTIQIPRSNQANLRQILSLQIEKEFPLSPDKLAWGHNIIDDNPSSSNRTILLAAVKRTVLEDYQEIFKELGIEARFTPTALAAIEAASETPGAFAILNVGRSQSELLVIEAGIPTSLRTLATGLEGGSDSLAERLSGVAFGGNLLTIGTDSAFNEQIETSLGIGVSCRPLHNSSDGAVSAMDVLEHVSSNGKNDRFLSLESETRETSPKSRIPKLPMRWVATVAALLLTSLLLRYVEPLIHKSSLETRIAEITRARAELPPIAEELDFLRFLEKCRPAYVNAVTVLADSLPRGTKFEALSLERNGGFSFRANMQNPQQAGELRKKLLESGLFTAVVLEEQTPAENNRKLSIRISARWTADPGTPSKTLDRIDEEAAKSDTNAPPNKLKG